MVDAVGSVSSNAGGRTAAMTAAPTATASGASAATSSSSKTALEPLSPTMSVDPLSGAVITEYLDSVGSVTAQVPSSAAVAYLRIGLQADGLPEQQADSTVIA